MRIGLGIGEAPFMPAGVKSSPTGMRKKNAARRWGFLTHHRYRSGYRASCSCIDATGMGWRTMFVIIGVAGILVGICW